MNARTVIALMLGFGTIGCSAQMPLTRNTAERIIRAYMATGQFHHERIAETPVIVDWFEKFWSGDTEKMRKWNQAQVDLNNHLVDAEVFQKAPDTLGVLGCNPQPACRESNKKVNYVVVPNKDVQDVYKGMTSGGISDFEYVSIVAGRPSDPVITGLLLEGNDAKVEFSYSYKATQVFQNIVKFTEEDRAKCSIPELSWNPPLFCSWPTLGDIAADKRTASAYMSKYDDGWRIVRVEP